MIKLPDFENFEPFKRLRRVMGADKIGSFSLNYKGKGLTREELDALSNRGIDVDFKDITKLKDGTLAYKDKRVLVYIRDIGDYSMHYKKYSSDVENLPKFHVSWCRSLSEKHEKNQFERYVVSQSTDGEFTVFIISGNKVIGQPKKRLRICKNCLENISWNDYNRNLSSDRKSKIVSDFLIPDFFEKYPRDLVLKKPTHTDLTAPVNRYSDDFNSIAAGLKERARWCCSRCDISLAEKGLRVHLHVHHIDRQKHNNDESNLEVLCRKCHAEESDHGHMRNSVYHDFLRTYNQIKWAGKVT